MGIENGLDMEQIAAQEMGANPENQELENEFLTEVEKTGETATALKNEMASANPETINSPAFQDKLSRLGEMLKSVATELVQGIKKGLKEEAELVKFLTVDILIGEPKDAIVSKAEDLMEWLKNKKSQFDINRPRFSGAARPTRLPRV